MKRFKSAITGEFVTEDFAKENPDTTVEMTMDNSQAVIEKLQADKAELLEALKYANRMLKNSKDAMYDENYIESLIQKHKATPKI